MIVDIPKVRKGILEALEVLSTDNLNRPGLKRDNRTKCIDSIIKVIEKYWRFKGEKIL